MPEEEKPGPDGQTPPRTQTVAPGAAEILADLFHDYITHIAMLRTGTQKAGEAFIGLYGASDPISRRNINPDLHCPWDCEYSPT